MNYLFTSDRLGFRNWVDADLPLMSDINSDEEVMKYFPSTQSLDQTQQFISRMQEQFEAKGFCYFAVDRLEDNEFIGFIGLSEQTYKASFTPCIDIGWRIGRKYWRNGYATEGAKRVLAYAFDELKLDSILSIAPVINLPSQNVMKKIGMKPVKTFEHSLLSDNDRLRECVLYEVKRVNS